MIRLLALTFAAAFAVQPALAQDEAAIRKACEQDFVRLCPGTMPGGGRIAACFKEKREQLSEGCRNALLAAEKQSGK